MRVGGRGWTGWACALALVGTTARAQGPPTPTIEQRLQKLEAANAQLVEQNRQLLERYDALSKKYEALTAQPGTPPTPSPSPPSPPSEPTSAEKAKPEPPPGKTPLKAHFGPGFELMTEDEEFQLQVHNQTQAELRVFEQGGQRPTGGGFYIPRERLIFSGRLTKPIEYEGSVEAAYGIINLLNAFANFHYDDRLQIKLGRYKVPFQYEYHTIPNVNLLQPERSLFGINYGFNREVGAMAWGQLLGGQLDYAVGAFNGTRNNFVDFNEDKDLIAYLNARPFAACEGWEALKSFNLGGSVAVGVQDNPVLPQALRTSVSQSNNPNLAHAAPAYLTFNDGVLEHGDRTLWSLHAAYFYRSLSLIAEWQSGFTDYIRPGLDRRVNVPVDGFYVAAGYFLTGEQVEGRNQVRPLRNFDLRRGKFGLGALELQARYSLLDLGGQVFTAGLADPALWSDRTYAIDTGLNWYLNPYVKIYLDWQHAEFGKPVRYRPGALQLTSDLFWLRCQIYF